jgi:hypothetical protein
MERDTSANQALPWAKIFKNYALWTRTEGVEGRELHKCQLNSLRNTEFMILFNDRLSDRHKIIYDVMFKARMASYLPKD